MKYSYIDIFSGCGWLSLWLYNSWYWKWEFTIEKNKDAFQTLKHNLIEKKRHFVFPKWLSVENHDINEVLKNPRLEEYQGKVCMVAGGPPCQGFSMAGKRNKTDSRNQLVYSYLKFIEVVKPKIVFFENVKGFAAAFKDKDRTVFLEWVIQGLKDIWYDDATYRIIDFSEYGIPQKRKRVILVATLFWKADEFYNILDKQRQSFLKNKWLNVSVSLWEAISDIEKKYWITQSKDSKGFMNWIYGPEMSPYQKYIRDGWLGEYVDSHRFPRHNKETEKKFETIIQEKLTSREISEKFNTKKRSTRLLCGNTSAPTITSLPDDLVHYCEPRILTVREYARLQSFPDSYEFKWKYTTGWKLRKIEVPRYTQIWNAIPPLFAEQVGKALNTLLKKYWNG